LVVKNGVNVGLMLNLNPMNAIGAGKAIKTASALNNGLNNLQALENDRARSPMEKAAFAKKTVAQIDAIVGNSLHNWFDVVESDVKQTNDRFNAAVKVIIVGQSARAMSVRCQSPQQHGYTVQR
jgi:hypothetical protein